jgi:steroid 5-alpha reductase family enzyme
MNKPAVDLRIIPIILVLVWGIRLSSHILARHVRTTEDARYVAWRNAWGNGWYFYARSFVQVFLLQGILAMIIATPVILITAQVIPLNLVWVIIGTIVWIGGFVCESVADAQLKTFLANSENRGHTMQSGLWKYSRHPNYFGEVTQWWGIFIIGLGTTLGILGIIGPLVITFLIVFVSGIPLAEASLKSTPGFAEYAQRTSVFIPFL